MTEVGASTGPRLATLRRAAAGARQVRGTALFWASNLAVGASTFVVLAVLGHQGGFGRLAAGSVVLGLVTVVAVVPGAVQLRTTAATAGGARAPRAPLRLAAGAGAALAILSPALAMGLSVPVAALALVAVQLGLAVALAGARGVLIGRGTLRAASANFALEAAGRVALGAALGAAWGATGLGAAVALATGLALVHGRGVVTGERAPEPAAAAVPAVLSLGAIALLANVDLLVAHRALGAAAGDAYVVAALPAKAVFFALFPLSWLAAGSAVGRPRTPALLTPVAATLALGVLAAGVLLAGRPLLGPLLGRDVPDLAPLGLLGVAMAMAAATSVAMAMAVGRDVRRPWVPALLAALAVGVAGLAVTSGTALAGIVLAGEAVALAGTVALLWAGPVVAPAADAPPAGAPARPPAEAPRAAPPLPPAAPVPRAGLVAAAVALLTACLLQAPGKVIADTKLDLALDPGGFLGRAMHLWDPTAAFGQVQNQAVGYLVPMGPFFAAAHALGVPAWVTQRVWIAGLLWLAFTGVVLVARALRVGRPAGWLVAGGAYALSPYFVGQVASTSAGLLPAALAPWALLPLIRGSRTGSPRRAAALSGLAVLAMGGVNAVSTLAVLLLPALWLVTRPRSPRRTTLACWWVVCTGLACAWWVAALAFQGRYGLDFLRFTETPDITQATTSALETLRGAGGWLMYLDLGRPWLPAGWSVATEPSVIVATSVLAAAGLAGLSRAVPERRFLLGALALGATCVAAGWSGRPGGVLAGTVRDALAGPLGPLRNVAKFEPVLRLPLALGLAGLLALVPRARLRLAATAVAGAAIVLGALPVLQGGLAPDGAFKDVPAFWRQTADFLARAAPDARALVVPAAPFAENSWGRPIDEPLQPLARSPWATRSLVPLGGVGSTRLLDTLEARFDTGRPSRSLRRLLARAGVRFVVVRNDLDWQRTGSPRPVQVHDVLRASGLRRVAAFGPPLSARRASAGALPDPAVGRREGRLPAVEIFTTGVGTSLVSAPPARGTPVVSGGPDAVTQLVARHAAPGRAAVLAADRPASLPAGPWFVGDALRRRDTDFGLLHDQSSYPLAPGERPAGVVGAPRQFLPRDDVPATAVARLDGLRSVGASSYGSWLLHLPELRPDNAFDGNPSTAWVAGRADGSAGQWVQATLARPRVLRTVAVRLLTDGPWRPQVTALRVTTDAGSRTVAVRPGEAVQTIPTVAGLTRHLRITLARVPGDRRGRPGAGLRDVGIPGVVAQRTIVLPQERSLLARSASAGPPTIALDRLAADPADQLHRDEEAQLQRAFRLAAPARLRLSGAVRGRPGAALDRLLTVTRGVRVRASSSWTSAPRWRPGNVADGSVRTSWIAAPPAPVPAGQAGSAAGSAFLRGALAQRVSPVPADVDARPALSLRWRGRRTLRSVRVADAGPVAAAPEVLRLASPDGVRVVRVSRGTVRFAPLRTDRLVVTFPQVQRRVVTGPGGRRSQLPVGLSELDFPALRAQRVVALLPRAELSLPCGEGPDVQVGDRRLQTAVDALAGRVVALRSVRLRVCGRAGSRRGIALPAGTTTVRTGGRSPFAVTALTLRPAGARPSDDAAPRDRDVAVVDWGDVHRKVRVADGEAALLDVRENFNRGWHATLGGRALQPLQLDGWKQGFVLPAGAGGVVDLRFAPDRPFRLALLAGAVLALALLALAVIPARRRTPDAAARATASPSRGAWAAGLVLATAAVALVCWPAAVAVPPLAVAARRRPAVVAGAAFVALAAAGVVAAADVDAIAGDRAGAFGVPAQLLSALALAAALAAGLAFRPAHPDSERTS